MEKNNLVNTENDATEETAIATAKEVVYGFEEAKPEDALIPRIKVVQALSPERKDKMAEEGDVINSLTKEKVLPSDLFIPIKMYYSNIYWNPDRSEDERMFCRSFDGRIGTETDGTNLACKDCRKNQFDNSKQGKEAQPVCTAYMNFLGFFAGSFSPVVLSFSKTNYNEGKKMLSIAKSLMKSIFSYTYSLEAKEVTKNTNSWFIVVPKLQRASTTEEQAFALQLFKMYGEMNEVRVDYEDVATKDSVDTATLETEI